MTLRAYPPLPLARRRLTSLGALLAALLFATLALSLDARRPELWIMLGAIAAMLIADVAFVAVVRRRSSPPEP